MMKRVKYQDIRHLLPEDTNYINERYFDAEEAWVLHHEGDLVLEKPLDLDNSYSYFFDGEEPEDLCYFIFVEGNVKAGNIYNNETDGSTGLVVMGNLTANNIVVGGQEIFVAGDLIVNQLFWGDYNHGELQVRGSIQAKVFINTDYGVDYKRFEEHTNIFIEHLLWDDVEDDYEDDEHIRQLLRPEYLLSTEDLAEEEIYSWKDWIFVSGLMKAMEQDLSALQDNVKPYKRPEEDFSFFFEDNIVSENNLKRFLDSDILVGKAPVEGESFALEYWDGPVFRRIFTIIGSPETTAVYFQYEEKFACMAYFTEHQNMLGKLTGRKEYRVEQAYKVFPEDKWLVLDKNAPQELQDFMNTQWNVFLWQYSEMVHLKSLFRKTVTREKLERILNLPLVQEKSKQYYTDDASLDLGSLHLQFRQENSQEDYGGRISVIRQENGDEDIFNFWHFDLVETVDGRIAPVLFSQDDNDYESKLYEVSATAVNKYKNAIRYWNRLERNIDSLNEAYLRGEISLVNDEESEES
ncbi:hypothetical protein M2T82_11340 [Elizabethkingia ursingii]|uniref:hypothetical protein n=1 Tax=Elizabethkingia ursingii TaxID=1756150 RepID=UPI0020123C5E|nr:hypothetical protein [Elizabethkingia ursingii]MCL1668658.1 hypothetical protein [Elizabethkingia ursingii]